MDFTLGLPQQEKWTNFFCKRGFSLCEMFDTVINFKRKLSLPGISGDKGGSGNLDSGGAASDWGDIRPSNRLFLFVNGSDSSELTGG